MRRDLVQAIHAATSQLVAVVTGGGADALSHLLREPGASRTLLEAVIPYSARSLADFLGSVPESACSERTARALSMQALLRALALSSPDARGDLAGVACTASLATDRPKKGDHRCHIAVHTLRHCTVVSLTFAKNRRSRAQEEEIVSDLLLNCIAETCGVAPSLALAVEGDESPVRKGASARDGWAELLLGDTDLVYLPHGDPAPPGALLPGAFNPLHEGHTTMARIAGELLGCRLAFELSIVNADKPPLDWLELAARVDPIHSAADLCLTRAATFVEKARIFPGVTFVVGADTLRRIADPRYYRDSLAACENALRSIRDAGCRFLVFGRRTDDRFIGLGELPLPAVLREICEGVPEERFRLDLSSTEIRARGR